MKLTCGALIFLGVGIVIVLYASHLSALAADSSFAPARAIYLRTATSMYLVGVPMLLIGGCLSLNVYTQRDSGMRGKKLISPVVPDSRKAGMSVVSYSRKVVCPECGFVLERELGIVKPDGSVICGKCFNRFIPQT
jgi:hypothetical protein